MPIMDQNSDTWGNKEADQAQACPECGTALRTGGPGRRPHFCSRSCSAKAYRRRRAEKHQDAVADALVSTRVEIPASGEAGRQELLDLAAAVQRTAARYLESLEEAARGEGDDPQCVRALERLEASLGAASTRIVRKAHHLRYEMVVARRKAERAAAAPPQHLDTAPTESTRDEVRTAPTVLSAIPPAAAPVLGAAVHPAAPLTRAAVPPRPGLTLVMPRSNRHVMK